ncbi:penicillin acylase family protein [Vulcanisaeta souniana]|uniref:Penicillin amidase n=1 Tax=Vulcanisaeta souniana JCM 11219 TaxID=1293586 RepID=A0A830DZ62_9CREN|nr:penicillin acylase family protein [Vulcanisaeta souniana]BDR91712.1 penicillin amidase [Vulcanisaeta souniana JCM 11219]GGI71030.1 penicillin amidase [Vulcanisaeta souniana JCM 11219]
MNRVVYGLVLSVIGLVVIIALAIIPISIMAPLYQVLNPGTGIWVNKLPSLSIGCHEISINVNGNIATVVICVTPDGFIRIASNQTWAVFYEQGYLTAKYRLAQIYFMSMMTMGNLSSLLGPSMLPNDEFFRVLLTPQVTEEIVNSLNKSSFTYEALYYYTLGVNAYVNSLSLGDKPIIFKVLGFNPPPWTMEDTFAIQQLLTWSLSGTADQLPFTVALLKMPPQVIYAFYPAYPSSIQYPVYPESWNLGIYNTTGNMKYLNLYSLNPPPPGITRQEFLNAVDEAIRFYLEGDTAFRDSLVSKLLPGINPFEHFVIGLTDEGSNNWVAVSPNGQAFLANDPHLTTTVPSIWIGFQLVGPGMNVVGVDFPGVPGVILGHNPYIAWGATDAEPQVVYYYVEVTSPDHPGEYYYDGSWIPFEVIHEKIYVKGVGYVPYNIYLARNGVVIANYSDVVIVMNWTGMYPTDEGATFLYFDIARNLSDFLNALSYFKVGIQNFAYADKYGNIGIFAWGLYPVVMGGDPRAVMLGNGSYGWVDFIPTQYQPYVLNPPSHFALSANEILVSPNYPYYVGWVFESGFRADEIYTLLSQFESEGNITYASMEAIQLNVHDYSTNLFLPPLLNALSTHLSQLTPIEVEAYELLRNWDGDFTTNSAAATIYYFWLWNYLNDTFMPWFQYYNITPADGLGQFSLFLGPDAAFHGPLALDLANWTNNYPNIQWFNDPTTGQERNATIVMLLAFNQTIMELMRELGPNPSTWYWGRVHYRELTSFFSVNALSVGPFPAPGDCNTINAAYGLVSNEGPSWRQIVNMAGPLSGVGVYPGGISENPLSPLYNDTTKYWLVGQYYTLIPQSLPQYFYYLYLPNTTLPG